MQPSFLRASWLVRYGLALVAACIGCGKLDDRPTVVVGGNESHGLVLASGDVHIPMAQWIARAIQAKMSSAYDFDRNQNEIANDLKMLENMVRQSSETHAAQVADLRRKLEEKASYEDVKQAIERIATEIEEGLSATEQHVVSVEDAMKRVHEVWLNHQNSNPLPVLHVNAKGEPQSHPLMVEYLGILSKCQTHRAELERLHALYKEGHPKVQAALHTYQALQIECAAFHQKALAQFLSAIGERQELMKVNRGGNDVVSRFDRQHSILWWIARVSMPNAGGRYPGLIQMTEYAVGPEAADILAAFKLAGAKTDDLAPFYTMHITNMPTDQKAVIFAHTGSPYQGMDILKACYNHQEGEVLGLVPAERIFGGEAIADWKKELLPNRDYLLDQTYAIRDDCRGVDEQVRDLSKNHPDTYEPLAALHKTRASLLTGKIRVVNTMGGILLRQSIVTYVEQLPRFRTISPEQRSLHANLLAPLLELVEASQCFDWENEVSQNNTWQRFLRYDSAVATEIQRQKQEQLRKEAEAEKQALERERVKQLEEQKKNEEREKARRENRSAWHTEVAATMIVATIKRSERTQEELRAIAETVAQTNAVLAQELSEVAGQADPTEPALGKASTQPASAELVQRLVKIESHLRSNNAQAKVFDASRSEEDMLEQIEQRMALKIDVAPIPGLFTGEDNTWCMDELCKQWARYVTASACNEDGERLRSEVHQEALQYLASAYAAYRTSDMGLDMHSKLASRVAVAAWVLHQTQPGQGISEKIVDPRFSWAAAWSFERAGLSDAAVANVYRRLIDKAPRFQVNTSFRQFFEIEDEEVREIEKARESRPFGYSFDSKAMGHLAEVGRLFRRATGLQSQIDQLKGARDPGMVSRMKEKDDLLAGDVPRMHEETRKLLEEGMRLYRNTLQRYSQGSGCQTARVGVWLYLTPLFDIETMTSCPDFHKKADVEATWQNFLALHDRYGQRNANCLGQAGFFWKWKPFDE